MKSRGFAVCSLAVVAGFLFVFAVRGVAYGLVPMTWSDPTSYEATYTAGMANGPTGFTSIVDAHPVVGGLKLRRHEITYYNYGSSSNNGPTKYFFDWALTPNGTTVPWTPTSKWAFTAVFTFAGGLVKTGTPGRVAPEDGIMSPTGGTAPTEGRVSWGVVTEPATGYISPPSGGHTWRPRANYPGGRLWTNAPGFMYANDWEGRRAEVYLAGGRNTGTNTYYWSGKYAFAFTSCSGSYVVTGSVDVTNSPTPPTIQFQALTVQSFPFGTTDPWWEKPNGFVAGAADHKVQAAAVLWEGGTTNATYVDRFAAAIPEIEPGTDSTVTPPPESGDEGWWTGTGFGWTDDMLSGVASQVSSLTAGISSWFWPVQQMNGW